MPEITVKAQCYLCDEHKSELGILLSIKESVQTNFENWPVPQQMDLIIAWFEQYKLDKRTQMIQDFKKTNIKSINKRQNE